MKNLLQTVRARAYITPGGEGYVVVSVWDVTQEEIDAAIDAEEELERWRKVKVWN